MGFYGVVIVSLSVNSFLCCSSLLMSGYFWYRSYNLTRKNGKETIYTRSNRSAMRYEALMMYSLSLTSFFAFLAVGSLAALTFY